MSLRWKLNRLAAMDRREIRHRVGQQGRATLERFGFFAATLPARTSDVAGRSWVEPLPRQFEAGKYCAAADRIIAGEFDVFAMRPAQLGFPPQLEPRSEDRARGAAHVRQGARLSQRADRRRHQVPVGAESSRGAADARAGMAFHARPALRAGVARSSIRGSSSVPMRAARIGSAASSTAMRLINWSFAWHLLGGDERECSTPARALSDAGFDPSISIAISSPAISRGIRPRTIICSVS